MLNIANLFRTNDKTLLVGNGPSVLDNPMGNVIDSFDGPVVRFNEFVLDPVECTGTKTDLWVIAWKSRNVAYQHPEMVHLMTHPPKRIQYFEKAKAFRSTGVATIFWFLEAGFKVFLHGFDYFHPEKKRHYFPGDRGNLIAGKDPKRHAKDREIVEQAIAEGMPISYLA